MSPIFQLTNHQELWAFIVTNLASVYIREGNRHQEVVGDMLHVRYPFFPLLLGGGVWEVGSPGHLLAYWGQTLSFLDAELS